MVDRCQCPPKFYLNISTVTPRSAEDWIGADIYISRDEGVSYKYVTSGANPAVQGVALSALPDISDPDCGKDARNGVLVEAYSAPSFTSAAFSQVADLNCNILQIGSEILAFETATPFGDNLYYLSGLYRGLRNTQEETGTHVIGERVTILDPRTLIPIEMRPGDVGQTFLLKYRHGGQTLAEANTDALVFNGGDHLAHAPKIRRVYRASIGSTNHLRIQWDYVSRVPQLAILSETVEVVDSGTYTIEIYNGSTIVRTIPATDTDSVIYSDAEQVADFGSAQTGTLKVRISTGNATVSQGRTRTQTVTVHKTPN